MLLNTCSVAICSLTVLLESVTSSIMLYIWKGCRMGDGSAMLNTQTMWYKSLDAMASHKYCHLLSNFHSKSNISACCSTRWNSPIIVLYPPQKWIHLNPQNYRLHIYHQILWHITIFTNMFWLSSRPNNCLLIVPH